MNLKNLALGALIGALLTAPLMALMYLANQLVGLPFVPFDVFNWMVPLLPGPLITFGIDRMIDLLLLFGFDVASTAKTAEQLLANVQFFGIGVVAGIVFYVVLAMRKIRADWLTGLILGVILGLPMVAISVGAGQTAMHPVIGLVWLLVLFLSWGLMFSRAYARLAAETTPSAGAEVREVEGVNRRRFVVTLGAATATITVVGAGVGAILARREQQQAAATLAESTAHEVDESAKAIFPNSDDMVAPVPGTRPEYTPIKDHYKVFLELEPTGITNRWQRDLNSYIK